MNERLNVLANTFETTVNEIQNWLDENNKTIDELELIAKGLEDGHDMGKLNNLGLIFP